MICEIYLNKTMFYFKKRNKQKMETKPNTDSPSCVLQGFAFPSFPLLFVQWLNNLPSTIPPLDAGVTVVKKAGKDIKLHPKEVRRERGCYSIECAQVSLQYNFRDGLHH